MRSYDDCSFDDFKFLEIFYSWYIPPYLPVLYIVLYIPPLFASTMASPQQRRRTLTLTGSLPLPPVMNAPTHRSSFAENMVKSMTIEEMRQLHQRALNEAEAKRTELQLVLASRYRELVGSSDEVIKMRERAQELHDLVNALPALMEKLSQPPEQQQQQQQPDDDDEAKHDDDDAALQTIQLRRELSSLPRLIHRLLGHNNVHAATVQLIGLFTLIASKTDAYPLANELASSDPAVSSDVKALEPVVQAQMKMVYLQMMTLPGKVTRIAKRNLLIPAVGENLGDNTTMVVVGSSSSSSPLAMAEHSAAALAAMNMLDRTTADDNRAVVLLDVYFDSKAKLLMRLLEQLSVSNNSNDMEETTVNTDTDQAADADAVLSKIVMILQYDIVLHAHAIFCARNFASSETLPLFNVQLVRTKVSKFLAGMIPLIRTKAKSVLINIAGTTAAALGQIRQSLYDKTDGADITKSMEWAEATNQLIDTRQVLQGDTAAAAAAPADFQQRQFSLWSALFSTTFSSLVNSLLNTAFGSVHSNVIATLTASLANAPPLTAIQPHEAYRNTLKIAVDLDQALLKVSEDAHELLVHAEEREESERRLRQSLYVQTCEILGRLVYELRRMAINKADNDSDATKSLIIGRLCFLLKFRLTALPKLLDPKSSPAALQQTLGMISFVDLQSAFELADDDEDGVIKIAEALEAVESAFSGTQFRGADMLRETLLLERDGTASVDPEKDNGFAATPVNVTLQELTLLTSRGLRHTEVGPASALGTLQASLDSIVSACFLDWAKYVVSDSSQRFQTYLSEFVHEACTGTDEEWNRLHPAPDATGGVSPFVVGYILDLASILNRTICPSDSISPSPNAKYAASLGVLPSKNVNISTIVDVMRSALLSYCVCWVASTMNDSLNSVPTTSRSIWASIGVSPAVQLYVNTCFIKSCFVERNKYSMDLVSGMTDITQAIREIDSIIADCEKRTATKGNKLVDDLVDKAFSASSSSLASLLGDDAWAAVSARGELIDSGSLTASSPCFRMPLTSSVRFHVLPVQADRSLTEIQLRSKFAKEKETSKPESLGGSVMSSGLGFMSSGLGFFKKN